MLVQLNPPLPVSTPKGDGLAHVIIDYGIEHDLCWVVFLDENAEIWTFKNQDIRAIKNITFGRSLYEALEENSQAKEKATNILKNAFKKNNSTEDLLKDARRMSFTMPLKHPCECEDQQASETVSQYTVNDNLKDHKGRLYEWDGKIKPDPTIAWNSWGDYLPDCKFYYCTRKKGGRNGVFIGETSNNFHNGYKTSIIYLDPDYDLNEHGMIVGWKPYV